VIAMPLRRAPQRRAELENFVGVTFAMLDAANGTRVPCRVTYAALCDRAKMDGNGDDWRGAWRAHERAIETLASENYDAGKPLVNGRVVVDTLELTPLSQGRNYFQSHR
jgi:hypothetical protein